MKKYQDDLNSLSLFINGKWLRVYGGPYRDKPKTHKGMPILGVKMAAEIDRPHAIDIPTEDFSVPAVKDMWLGLFKAYRLLRRDVQLYVGCMGGIGRTGLFMALLTKVNQHVDDMQVCADPVAIVRQSFDSRAVETTAQAKYVKDFPMFWLKWALKLIR